MKLKNTFLKISSPVILIILLFGSFTPFFIQAEVASTYTLIESLPKVPNETNNMGEYLGGIFNLMIGIASALAVLMIVIGGFKYITSEGVFTTADAKKTITDALLGLILVLASWLILNTINTDFVGFNVNLDAVTPPPPSTPTTPPHDPADRINCWCKTTGGGKQTCIKSNPNDDVYDKSLQYPEDCISKQL